MASDVVSTAEGARFKCIFEVGFIIRMAILVECIEDFELNRGEALLFIYESAQFQVLFLRWRNSLQLAILISRSLAKQDEGEKSEKSRYS